MQAISTAGLGIGTQGESIIECTDMTRRRPDSNIDKSKLDERRAVSHPLTNVARSSGVRLCMP